MDIKRKVDGAIVRDVKNAHNVNYKWVKYSPDCRTEYSEEHWEPVEEWVKIEVCREQWRRVDTNLHMFTAQTPEGGLTAVSWRDPQ